LPATGIEHYQTWFKVGVELQFIWSLSCRSSRHG